MKSTTFAAALLASVAVAQPHGHHRRHKHENELEKRELVVEWETVWETATVYVDETTTETVLPEKTPEPEPTTSTGVPGQFFETPIEQPTTLATSTTEAPPPPPEPTTEAPPAPTTTSTPPPPPTTTSAPPPPPPPPSTTTAAAPIVELPTLASPPPAETTTSSPPAQPTSAAPPADSSSGSGGGVSGKGEITYYNVGMGACGYDDTGADDTENIVAMPKGMWLSVSSLTSYGVNQPAHPWCDKTITITANGKSIQAKVRDQCPGCDDGDIDVTPHAFLELFGSLDAGRLQCEWSMD